MHQLSGSFAAPILISAAMSVALVTGCRTDEAARYYGAERYPPRSPSEVEMLYAKPQRPFTVIADIQAYNVSPEHMQRRAAEVGGDAVILVRGGGQYDHDEVWASADRHSQTYTRLLATVIKFD